MDYTKTDVYNYINYIEVYLKGDLSTFHDVCRQIEGREARDISPLETNITQSFGLKVSTSSTTTTTETTMFPGSPAAKKVEEITTPKYFRLTVPVTLTLFSIIDIIGYFLGSHKENMTGKSFEEFLKGQLSAPEINLLTFIYRHGMSHGYFPKLDVGVSYHSSNPNQLFFKSNEKVVLNVAVLEQIVLDKLSKTKNDTSLYPHMETRYQNLISNYNTDRGHIEAIKKTL